MQKYAVVEKMIGETPLEAIRKYKKANPEVARENMAYAGRLDPMASGKLLILIGEECKKQEEYHGLDKSYRFEVLLGTDSDTGDVLGIVDWKKTALFDKSEIVRVSKKLLGSLSLPYPRFSSKTVAGKPLHLWTLEGRLDEIEIPIAHTDVYKLVLQDVRLVDADQIYQEATDKIETIPPVSEESKELGRDFRRDDIRIAWRVWRENHKNTKVQIATFDCIVSSGTYIRSLAPELARQLGSVGLAYSIHRQEIGRYWKLPFGLGLWRKRYN